MREPVVGLRVLVGRAIVCLLLAGGALLFARRTLTPYAPGRRRWLDALLAPDRLEWPHATGARSSWARLRSVARDTTVAASACSSCRQTASATAHTRK